MGLQSFFFFKKLSLFFSNTCFNIEYADNDIHVIIKETKYCLNGWNGVF